MSSQSIRTFFARVAQFVLGGTFLVSGLAKCIDPIGTAIKIDEYLGVLGMPWLAGWSLGLSWLLCIGEFVVGMNIFFGRNRKFFFWLVLALMLFYTPFTLWIALRNPVSDCGCFGDAVVLSNWQTFWKNVVLLVAAAVLCLWRHHRFTIIEQSTYTLYFYWTLIVVTGLCYMGTWRLPYIDFRPYRPGVRLSQDEASSSETSSTEYIIIYEKEGIRKAFSLDSIPEESEGWTFVETQERSSSGGSSRPNARQDVDFFAFDHEGNEVTSVITSDTGYVFLLTAPYLSQTSQHDLDRIEALYEYAQVNGYRFYGLTGRADAGYISEWRYLTGAEYPIYESDASVLVTMVRSNPGLVLLHDGMILWKSCISDLDVDVLTNANLTEQSYGQKEQIDRKKQFFWLSILLIAPFLLLLLLQMLRRRSQRLRMLRQKENENYNNSK